MTQPIRTIRIATQGPSGPAGLYPHPSWDSGSVPYVRSSVLAHNGGVWLALRDTSVEPSVAAPDDWASWIDFSGMISGVATLGGDGKLLLSQLPAVAITDTFQVASQAAMLALAAHKGDIAIRSDLSKTFVLAADDATVLANWKELLSPGAVLSVAGRTGAVTLSAGDVAGLSASATTDTTNAGNISSGTISNARLSGVALVANNLSDLANAATARTNLGLGTIATQSASAVAITGGTITGIGTPSASTDVANKAYVDALATLVSGALLFKGAWDASAGTFPGGGTAQTGYFYKVSVAGTVNGVAFDVGDDIYAVVNNASTSTYAANWLRIDGVISGSEVTAALGYTPLSPGNNLSDLGSVATARTNLGLVASATTDTTNAGNISSGTLPSARLAGAYTGITQVGTLTAGVWNGTKIGLAYGGTNLDMTATGGTSQVLRQSTSGGAVTVSQLAQADISGLTTTDAPAFAGSTLTPAANAVALAIANQTHTSVTKSLSITQTQNSTGTNPGVIFANLIPGASVPNAASLLMDLQYNSSSVFNVNSKGFITVPNNQGFGNGGNLLIYGGTIFFGINDTSQNDPNSVSGGFFRSRSSGGLAWSNVSYSIGALDTALMRNAAGVVEINNGTAGTFRDLKLRDMHSFPSASLTPSTNGEFVIEATGNTTLTFKLKGSDGTVRSAAVALS